MTYTPRHSRYMIGKHDEPPNPDTPWFYCGIADDPTLDYGEQATWAEALASVIEDDRAHRDRRCLCGQVDPPQVGDPVQSGTILGFGIETGMRYARVVGYLKRRDVQGARIVVRLFRPGDGRWPSGGYARVWLTAPWEHAHPQTTLSPAQEPFEWDQADGLFRLPKPA